GAISVLHASDRNVDIRRSPTRRHASYPKSGPRLLALDSAYRPVLPGPLLLLARRRSGQGDRSPGRRDDPCELRSDNDLALLDSYRAGTRSDLHGYCLAPLSFRKLQLSPRRGIFWRDLLALARRLYHQGNTVSAGHVAGLCGGARRQDCSLQAHGHKRVAARELSTRDESLLDRRIHVHCSIHQQQPRTPPLRSCLSLLPYGRRSPTGRAASGDSGTAVPINTISEPATSTCHPTDPRRAGSPFLRHSWRTELPFRATKTAGAVTPSGGSCITDQPRS